MDVRSMLSGRRLLVTAVAAAAVAGGGAATALAAGHDGGDRGGRTGAPPATAVSARQAADAALKAAPGVIDELELDDADDRTVWEADVLAQDGTWREVVVDSGTGKVLTNEPRDRGDDRGRDDDHGDDHGHDRGDDHGDDHGRHRGHEGRSADGAAALRNAKVTAAAAADVALKAVPGRVTSLEFERRRDGAAWEARVAAADGTRHRVTLDAATARISANTVVKD
ncbi:PepSY domain-containing protein [Actinomadura fibrosa]|uniref:PepSY domain-containing protein n=1 Tax=Actinomadura fibrosa TaxID=111802 RepID=A0ABW2XP40_9ACTN